MATARPNTLRAVSSSDTPKPRKTVADAAASGDHRALLVAMRERIAQTISSPDCPPRDLSSLTRRLQDIAKEIETIDLRARQESGEDSAATDETWDDSAI